MSEVLKTPGEYAKHHAQRRRSPFEMPFTTGRILVKRAYEGLILPSETDYEELSQYLGLELKALGIVLYKSAGILSVDEERTMWGRTLAINQAAQDSPVGIVVYDRNGRLEPNVQRT